MHSLPVDRLTYTTLNFWQYMAKTCFYLCGSIMNLMLMLSNLDTRTWLALVQPKFEKWFFECAVEYSNDQAREAAWVAMDNAFSAACSQTFSVVNGNGSDHDSDAENKMQIDREPHKGIVVTYLWTFTINCLKRSTEHWEFAGKAFESAVNMFRYAVGGTES
jgi:hypothetical protein